MGKPYSVIWSERSLRNALAIKQYLSENFSDTEIRQFEKLLENFETVVAHFPDLYPQSQKQAQLRRAVLNKNLSVFYTVGQESVIVVAMQDNRQENPGL